MNKYVVIGMIAAAFSGGFWSNGQRWEIKYQDLQLLHAKSTAASKDRTLASVLEATQAWSAANKTNEASYENLQRSLAAMRSTIGGLRNDFAGLPGFVRDASRENLQQYSTACTAIFERMAAAGGEMAESGGRVSKLADQHAADSLK